MSVGSLKLKGKHNDALKKSRRKKEKKANDTKQISKVAKGEIVTGIGTIVTNGSQIHGFDTEFTTQLEVGDTLIVTIPTTGYEEKRMVEHVASQRSAIIATGFSMNISGKTEFTIRKDREELQKAANKIDGDDVDDVIQSHVLKKLHRSKATTITYRERLTWGYKTIEEKVNREMTAEELLDERVKRSGADKYCS